MFLVLRRLRASKTVPKDHSPSTRAISISEGGVGKRREAEDEDREEEEATETEGEDEKLTREPPQIGEHLNILDNYAL